MGFSAWFEGARSARLREVLRHSARDVMPMLIGTRTVFVETPAGDVAVPIRVFMPEQVAEQIRDCRYEIDWPEGLVASHMQGNDALHALHLVQMKIGVELYMSRYHHERKMWWMKPWVGYGFPLPKGARDDLIGHDQQFYGDAPTEKR
jgi:hypothetical protein